MRVGRSVVVVTQLSTQSNDNLCNVHAAGNGGITTTIKLAIKLTIKLKTSLGPASLAQLLQPSLAFCCKLQPMTAYGTPSLAATYNKMPMRAATVVQVLQDLF